MLIYRLKRIENIIDKGKTEMGYDLVKIFKILEYINNNPGCSVSDIVKNVKISFANANKYLTILEERGAIESKGEKPKKFYISKKGINFLYLLERAVNELGLRIV